jgi:hypothetical protein
VQGRRRLDPCFSLSSHTQCSFCGTRQGGIRRAGIHQSRLAERGAAKIEPWASVCPYANGGLFGRPPGSADVLVGMANEKANEKAVNGAPGSADVPVGMANEKANDGAANGRPLEPHSLAGEDAGVLGANEDVGAPGCDSRGDLKKSNASATRVRRRCRAAIAIRPPRSSSPPSACSREGTTQGQMMFFHAAPDRLVQLQTF